MLWIAFELLYLWHCRQLSHKNTTKRLGCELLSNYCIFDIVDNIVNTLWRVWVLWIAFELLYLWHCRQPGCHLSMMAFCCELLSNYCIFDIVDNQLRKSLKIFLLWIAFELLYLWHCRQLTFSNFLSSKLLHKVIGLKNDVRKRA